MNWFRYIVRRQVLVALTGVAGGVALAVAALTGAGGEAPGALAIANADTCETSHASLDANEMALIEAINARRADAGLAPYTVSASLSKTAAWMAEDFNTSYPNVYADHRDSTGRSVTDRGLDCIGVSIGENIAWGAFGGPEGVVDAWMGSAGHRANILSTWHVSIGVGNYGATWTANFSHFDMSGPGPGGTNPSPSPSPSQEAANTVPATATPTQTPTQTPTLTPTPTPTPSATPTPSVVQQLNTGTNLVTYTGPVRPLAQVLASVADRVQGVYRWDAAAGVWLRYLPGVPDYVNTLPAMEPGAAYFVMMESGGSWTY